jgi:hypothetical protein
MEILLGTLIFMVITFPYSYFWHLKLFKHKYEQWQFFEGKVSPPFGLVAIITQGIIMSFLYFSFFENKDSIITGLTFALIIGTFHWSVQGIGMMGKNSKARTLGFFLIETLCLIGQFGMFGILITLIY